MMSFWTAERITELKSRFAKWETFTEIARALGHRSRNAVIGKAHRLGLRRGPDRAPPRPKQPRTRRLVVRINGHRHFEELAMPAEQTPPGFAAPKRFIALEADECHWPGPGIVGPDLECCAAPIVAGYPYCLAHCRMAYTAPPSKRIKAP